VHRRVAQILAACFLLRVWSVAVYAQTPAARGERPFSVTHYDVQIEPRLESRSVTGTVTVSVVLHRDDVETIVLDRGRLEIDGVQEDGRTRAFVLDGTRVRITLPRGRPNAVRTLTVRYHGAPSSGVVFSAEREQVYTVFSTSQWMTALDEPSARATLRLRVIMPREWTGAGSGRHVSRRLVSPDKALVEWRVERPVPTYTFGFAVGRFDEVEDRRSRVGLTYLARGMSPDDVRRVFDESARMMAFFEERAGVAYPANTYSQVLVERTRVRRWPGSRFSPRRTAARSWLIRLRSASSLTSSPTNGGATWSPAMRGRSSG